jgi:hypothetical protein
MNRFIPAAMSRAFFPNLEVIIDDIKYTQFIITKYSRISSALVYPIWKGRESFIWKKNPIIKMNVVKWIDILPSNFSCGIINVLPINIHIKKVIIKNGSVEY